MKLSAFRNLFIVADIKKKVFFTLGVLLLFRFGAHIPLPGIDTLALAEFYEDQGQGLLSFFNTFSGGALKNMSIFALGVLPYISASIIMQLMTAVIPFLERLSKEGDQGRQKITQYTRYFALLLSIFQAIGIVTGLKSLTSPNGSPIILNSITIFTFTLVAVVTLATGTMFVMWLGEQINERGIGNGASLIIFAGIIASIPSATFSTFQLLSTNELDLFVLILVLGVILLSLFAIIFIETAIRKIPIQYARRMVGRNVVGAQNNFLPLKLNSSGVIPPIFASSLLAFPATFSTFVETPWIRDLGLQMLPGNILYDSLFVILIFFFCFFYTAIQFNPTKISEELKKHGGTIISIRPGKQTSEFLNFIITRLTLVGAAYLSIVCIFPSILYNIVNVPFFFGGTSLLIVIGVALDLSNQFETQMVSHNYSSFFKKKEKNKY